jgi:hypothetical protein
MLHVQEESVDYLILHCDVASPIWSRFFNRFGMFWVMPRHVIDLHDCWWSFGRPKSAAVWKMMPTCLFWCLWREKNDKNFENRERGLWEKLFLCCLKLCIFGRRRMCLLYRLVLVILFFILPFLVRLFLSIYLGVPYAFNEIGFFFFLKKKVHERILSQ